MGKRISSDRLLERLRSGADELVDHAGALLGSEGQELDADAVHELRVTSKRLRAVRQLLRPALGAEAARPPEREMRHLAKAFDGRRGLVSLGETLDRLEALPAPKRSVASAEAVALQALREAHRRPRQGRPTPARSDSELIRIIEAQRAALRDRLHPMRPRDWGQDRGAIARHAGRRGMRWPCGVVTTWRRRRPGTAPVAHAKLRLDQIGSPGRPAGSRCRRSRLAGVGQAGRHASTTSRICDRSPSWLAPELGPPEVRETLEGMIVRERKHRFPGNCTDCGAGSDEARPQRDRAARVSGLDPGLNPLQVDDLSVGFA
ncbi:MAG: CHAD domain-containing protein [Gammaproteobacteria bacterium]|nr:CHAD domain-containing protein [Gammaproteobacteria bacterium]